MSADVKYLGVGLHHNVKASVYHADPCEQPSLSSGIVRTIRSKSLAHAKLEHPRLGGMKRKLTPSLSFGGYMHALIANDTSGFDVRDFPTFESKAAKEWADAVTLDGREPCLQRTADAAEPVAKAIMARVGEGLTIDPCKTGDAEVTAIWKEGDVWCRARFDRLVCDAYADIWDWKSTDDITDRGIVRSILEYGYHIQAAFYMRGLSAVLPEYTGRVTFTLGFGEKGNPNTVRRVKLDPVFLAVGKQEVAGAIDQWKSAMKTGEFPGIPVDTFEAVAPAWMDDEAEINIGGARIA